MNDRQSAALLYPTAGDPESIMARRHVRLAGDGCWITTILAVDR